MKRFAKIFMLVCLMAGLFVLSAYADYVVNGESYTNWEDAKAYANTISGDITIEFDGTVELNRSDVEDGTIFPTKGSVSFIGATSSSVVHIVAEYNVLTFNQPGGLKFSALTLKDDSWGEGVTSRTYRYFDVIGPVAFSGVNFPADSGVRVGGGNVSFDNCTFDSTADEYGLWIAAGNVTVTGGSFNGDRAIKVSDIDCQGSSIGLNASNVIFKQTNKAAIELDLYSPMTGEGITLKNNTYENGDIINKNGNYDDNKIVIAPYPFFLDITSAELKVKDTVQLTAGLEGIRMEGDSVAFDAAKVVWSSSDEKIATVDENGLVTAVAPGSATITATYDDGAVRTATCEVKVIGVSNTYNVPSTADNSNVPLWGALLIGFAAVALLTGKKRKA